jgi:hypothetical protein
MYYGDLRFLTLPLPWVFQQWNIEIVKACILLNDQIY